MLSRFFLVFLTPFLAQKSGSSKGWVIFMVLSLSACFLPHYLETLLHFCPSGDEKVWPRERRLIVLSC